MGFKTMELRLSWGEDSRLTMAFEGTDKKSCY